MANYKEGDLAWIKWKKLWWPCKVIGERDHPADLDLPEQYVSVVQYIGESDVEVICNTDDIYPYDCEKKEEFLRRGIKTESSNFKKLFSERVRIAENLVNGDPDILSKIPLKRYHPDIFATPPESSNKKLKKELKPLTPEREYLNQLLSKKKKKESQLPARVITHPRFVSNKDDHTVRYLADSCEPSEKQLSGFSELYHCQHCDFATSRLNNLISHNQTHSSSPKKAYIVPIPEGAVGSVKKTDTKNTSGSDCNESVTSDSEESELSNIDDFASMELGDSVGENNSGSHQRSPSFYDNIKEIFASRALRVHLNSLLLGEIFSKRQDIWIEHNHNPQLLRENCCMEFLHVVDFDKILTNSQELLRKLTIFVKRANLSSLKDPETRRSFILYVLLPEAIAYALKKLNIEF